MRPGIETLEPKQQVDESSVRAPFPEVDLEFIGESWTEVEGSRWDRVEPIPILDFRGACFSVVVTAFGTFST